MTNKALTHEEQQVLDDFDAGVYQSVLTDDRRGAWVKMAGHTIRKEQLVGIRITRRDLASLQRLALEEGVPCQTLISSILHKYLSGSLQDIVPHNRDGSQD